MKESSRACVRAFRAWHHRRHGHSALGAGKSIPVLPSRTRAQGAHDFIAHRPVRWRADFDRATLDVQSPGRQMRAEFVPESTPAAPATSCIRTGWLPGDGMAIDLDGLLPKAAQAGVAFGLACPYRHPLRRLQKPASINRAAARFGELLRDSLASASRSS